jgi:hypothetical protein
MSEDRQAQAEAWTRKKPKRIIQNQRLIQLGIILCIAVPIPLAGVVFWLVFVAVPHMPLILFVTWLISSALYIGLEIVVRYEKKHS